MANEKKTGGTGCTLVESWLKTTTGVALVLAVAACGGINETKRVRCMASDLSCNLSMMGQSLENRFKKGIGVPDNRAIASYGTIEGVGAAVCYMDDETPTVTEPKGLLNDTTPKVDVDPNSPSRSLKPQFRMEQEKKSIGLEDMLTTASGHLEASKTCEELIKEGTFKQGAP